MRRITWIWSLGFVVAAAWPPAAAAEGFVLWDSFPVTNPFSVTAAVRGLNPDGPTPQVRLEALVGFNSGGLNQFAYHGSVALPAPEAGSPARRAVDTTAAIDFTDSGVQSAFNGLCCSNHARGIDNDQSLHAATNFGQTSSTEILISLPEEEGLDRTEPPGGSGSVVGDDDDVSDDDDDDDDDDGDDDTGGSGGQRGGPVSFRRVYAASRFPENGLRILSITGPPGGAFTEETELTDCRSVASNWHFGRSGSDSLDETYVACVKTNGSFAIKRVSLVNFAVQEIVLAAGVPTTSAIFAYLHAAACPAASGTVVGAVLPRSDLGTTTFFATFLDVGGSVVGTAQTTLAGARANHQAFYCLSRDEVTTFVYHGSGQSVGQTDTFVIETSAAALTEVPDGGTPMPIRQLTENRRTDWADDFTRRIRESTGAKIEVVYAGLDPVAEVEFGAGSQVRYGGIEVPLFFDGFESGDTRYWSQVVN